MTYISFGKLITKSVQHHDLWIINYPDGGFVSVHADERTILLRHPKGGSFDFNERFTFKPSKAREKPENVPDFPPTKKPKKVFKKIGVRENPRVAAKRDFRSNF